MNADPRIRLVARREFVERVRDKGFLISTAITVVVLAGFILISAFLDRGVVYVVGLVGDASRSPVEKAAVFAKGADIRIRLRVMEARRRRRPVFATERWTAWS